MSSIKSAADLTEVYQPIRKLLYKYSLGLLVREEIDNRFELMGDRKVRFIGRDYETMFFASAVIQKSFVGFYFFPIYTHPSHFKNLSDPLRKCLKGKSCFHIKKTDENLLIQIEEILDEGFSLYKREGFI